MNKMVLDYGGDGQTSFQRCTARGVWMKSGECLMTYVASKSLYIIPGGGKEGEETMDMCLKREFEEETGFVVESATLFVILEERFIDATYTHYYYHIEKASVGQQHLTDEEKQQGMVVQWMPIHELSKLLAIKSNAMVNVHNAREQLALTAYFEWMKSERELLTKGTQI